MAFGQNPLYQAVKEELLNILKDSPKRRKDIVEQIKAKYDVSERWVDDILAGLVKLGVIERCKELGKGVYAISCPKPQDITRYTDNEEQSEGGGGNES
jgi:predicted transcriptional regulator